jgi:hypothetical protein
MHLYSINNTFENVFCKENNNQSKALTSMHSAVYEFDHLTTRECGFSPTKKGPWLMTHV